MIKWRGNESRIGSFVLIIALLLAAVPFAEVKPKIWSSALRPGLDNEVYDKLTLTLNMLTNRNTTPSYVLSYIDQRLPYLSGQEKTKVMYKYHAYLLAKRPSYDEKIFFHGNHKLVYKYFYYAYRPEMIPKVEEYNFRKILAEMDASGYYLKRDKNLYHPFINYKRLENTFVGLSAEGLSYLEIMDLLDTVESREMGNKELYYKNVEKLLLKCDYFINRFPLSDKNHEIQALFNDELEVYIFGNESFESYDNFTGKVDQGLINSYLRLSQYLESENLGLVLNRYTKMVMRNDNVVVNDFLQYINDGIQKNRTDFIVSRSDHIKVKTDMISFSGDHQYIPRIEGYRHYIESENINEKLLQNVYKYVYQGWHRGYQVQNWQMQTSYKITYAGKNIMALYQRIGIRYENGQSVHSIACLNYDFATGHELQFEELFLNYNLQKKKILDSLEQDVTNYDIGTFERIEPIDLDEIDNFVITDDGIEVFLNILDDSGSKVGYITAELSFSEFYTIIEPDYRF